MVVRELLTKIGFMVDKSGASAADKNIKDMKNNLNSVDSSAKSAGDAATKSMHDISTSASSAAKSVNSSIDSTKNSINNAAQAAGNFQDKLGRWHAASGRFLSASEKSALGLGKSVQQTSMTIGSLSGKLSTTASSMVSGISRVGSAVGSLNSQFGVLAATVVAAFSAGKIKDTADEMMNLDGRLRTVTKTEEERYATEDKLYSLSQNNRQSLESMGDLYYKVARGAKQFGVSEEDSMRVTDVVSKALTVGGASATEAKASILQLGQAIGSGVLQGDELHSLDENASLLMQHMAEHFGVTIGQLKKMGSEGKLTSTAVIEAILASGDTIDGEFGKMPMTIGQALQKVDNAWDHTIMKIQRKTNVFGRIATFISDQLEYIESESNALMDLASGPQSDSEEDQNKYAELQSQHEILVGILDVWKQISETVKSVEDFLGTDNMAAKILMAAAAVGSLFVALGLIGGLLGGISTVVSVIGTMFSVVFGVITALSLPVVAAIAAIAAVIYVVREHWDTFVQWFEPGINKMMENIDSLKNSWNSVQPYIRALIPILKLIAEVIGITIVGAITVLWDLWVTAFTVITAVINNVAWAMGQLGEIIQTIEDKISGLISKAERFLGLTGQMSGAGGAMDKIINNALQSNQNINIGSINVPTADDVGKGVNSFGGPAAEAYF